MAAVSVQASGLPSGQLCYHDFVSCGLLAAAGHCFAVESCELDEGHKTLRCPRRARTAAKRVEQLASLLTQSGVDI